MTTPNISSNGKLSDDEEQEINQFYEQRADHLELEAIKRNTVLSAGTEEWVQALTGTGAKLIIGPRGCGKTHLMRFAFSQCVENAHLPFSIYTNLNRYYHLEPALRRRPDAVALFYSWVLANILVGLYDAVDEFQSHVGGTIEEIELFDFEIQDIQDLVGTLEQSRSLTDIQEALCTHITIDRVKNLIFRATELFSRRRAVLFIDDAALTLAPEYLPHFFDIYRALKAAKIAPKASAYPGTTEFGPSFHVAHEAETVFVWKSVTDGNYLAFMREIASKRFPEVASLPEEIQVLLAYAGFGVPRSYMTLVRSFTKARNASPSAASQSLLNKVIEDFCSEKLTEYHSLAVKAPLLATIIHAGATCFTKIVADVAEASQAAVDTSARQIFIGITADGLSKAYVKRMLLLLEEAGMLYSYPSVSHGAEREYARFVPHMAALVDRRAFTRKGAFSPKLAVEMLQRPDEKHPVRRSISTLLDETTLDGLRLDLPNCVACGSKRMEGAKYCLNCGAKLTDESSYDRIMKTTLADVPGLTGWQRKQLIQSVVIPPSVGEFLSLQDKGTMLRTIPQIGRKRAKTVIDAVDAFLEEFLS